MKKTLLTVLVSINLLSVFILSSFSIVKAESLTPGSTSTYGSYYTETYGQNTQTATFDGWTLNLPFVSINLNSANSSVFHMHYTFNDLYSGIISVTINTQNNYVLTNCEMAIDGGYFQSIPSKGTNNNSKTFQIGLYKSNGFDFYLVHKGASASSLIFATTTTYTISYNIDSNMDDNELLEHIDTLTGNIYDYMVDDMTDTFLNIYNRLGDMQTTNENILETEIFNKYFPQYNLVGYLWASSYSSFPQSMYDTDIPWVYISTSQNINSYNNRHRFFVDHGSYVDIYLLATWWLNTDRVKLYHLVNDDTHVLNMTVDVVGRYSSDSSNTYHTVYLHKIRVTAPNRGDEFSLEFTGNVYAYLLYFANNGYVPDDIADTIGIGHNNVETDLLSQILQKITEIAGDEQYDTTPYDNFINDVGTFFTNLKNSFPSINLFSNDINTLPAFTGSNTHLDEMSGFVGDVYTGVTNSFPFVKTFIILGAVVLLMKVFL